MLSAIACATIIVTEERSQQPPAVGGVWEFLKLALFLVLAASLAVCVLRFVDWVKQTVAGRRLNSMASHPALRREIPVQYLLIALGLPLALLLTALLFKQAAKPHPVQQATQPQPTRQAPSPPTPVQRCSFRGRVYLVAGAGPTAVADVSVRIFPRNGDVDPIVSSIIREYEVQNGLDQARRGFRDERERLASWRDAGSGNRTHDQIVGEFAQGMKQTTALGELMISLNKSMLTVATLDNQLSEKIGRNGDAQVSRTNYEGRFAFSNVRQGDYWVMVRYGTEVQTAAWLREISIKGDTDVELANSNAVLLHDSRW